MSGYHKRKITKGEFTEFSKIVEEFEELQDAHEQCAKIMILCEISDLYGAIEGYIWKHFQLTMKDVAMMNELTKRAFEDGTRISE